MATGELTAEVVEEVASNLEEAAEVVRRFNPRTITFVAGGVVAGIAIGFYFGRRWQREKLRMEAFEESEKELDQIRAVYNSKIVAAEPKPELEEIVEEKGYGVIETPPRPLRPPVPVVEPPTKEERGEIQEEIAPRVFRTEEAEKDKNDGWSYPHELSQRSATKPFIIHQDEYFTNETEYSQVSYTYYEGDDVLADTDGTVLENRENLIGRNVLTRFGHGSDDFNVVYVRNPHLELEMEINRDSGSYEEEVQGLTNEQPETPEED